MAQPITTTLDPEQQRIAGEALNGTVVDLIDLTLIAKQAHWNVIGPRFRSLHLALDELVTDAREFTDDAAERATAIGVSPDGRARTVADGSGAQGLPAGWQQDVDVVDAITGNIAAIVRRMRQRVDVTDKADPVTQDLLIGITARLEQLHWMWEAQQG
ncbi:starvation-inducible DNA-binding protein [Nocardia transvalensis]|uniref:Starvation-inducible DNA-binding protein n=1 Tax=Nocardia transvalensis TaxID=37333 RepID=A0A7W9PJV4_9NOCA|nr:DNA starvation/stationary phase protection protein [Nocardia transvalensis]MBB5917305.1 starvation-inducible DNA-binding protein [Nocardia transvalensis]